MGYNSDDIQGGILAALPRAHSTDQRSICSKVGVGITFCFVTLPGWLTEKNKVSVGIRPYINPYRLTGSPNEMEILT